MNLIQTVNRSASALHPFNPGRIKLFRIPGNRVTSEAMEFAVADVKSYGGPEAIMDFLIQAMVRELKILRKDVGVASMRLGCERVELRCVAHLSPLGKEHTDENSALMAFRHGGQEQPSEIPDFIDV